MSVETSVNECVTLDVRMRYRVSVKTVNLDVRVSMKMSVKDSVNVMTCI